MGKRPASFGDAGFSSLGAGEQVAVRIRLASPEDAQAIARVMVATWRSAYAGVLPDDYLAGLAIEPRARRTRELLAEGVRFALVAVDERSRVFGVASAGPERGDDPRYEGELTALYVLPGRQRQGAGSALVEAAAAELAERGMRAMIVWVLAANRARGFYERLGGVYVREQQLEIAGVTLPEVAYGWASTDALVVAHHRREAALKGRQEDGTGEGV